MFTCRNRPGNQHFASWYRDMNNVGGWRRNRWRRREVPEGSVMINHSNEPSTGPSEMGGMNLRKRGGVALGVALILIGVLSFVQVLTGIDVWHWFWPLILIAVGVGILAERGGWL
jgi:hypothetical protein